MNIIVMFLIKGGHATAYPDIANMTELQKHASFFDHITRMALLLLQKHLKVNVLTQWIVQNKMFLLSAECSESYVRMSLQVFQQNNVPSVWQAEYKLN